MSSSSSMMDPNDNKKRIAAIGQLCSTSNKLQNLLNVAYCAGQAKQQGACMLFLPECFGFLGESAEQTLAEAEDDTLGDDDDDNAQQSCKNDDSVTNLLKSTVQQSSSAEGPDAVPPPQETSEAASATRIYLLDGIQTIARVSGLWISGGGMHVKAPASQNKVYNTHLIVDSNGKIQARYNKVHLFDVSIPSRGINLQESKTTLPGQELVVVCKNSPLGTLGLTTCYDVRFPEQFIALRQAGASILLVPSAFTCPTGQAHWHTLLRARAIENQSYVIAAAQYGQHNSKRQSYGHSLAVDPWGKILADAGGYDSDTTTTTAAAASITTPSVIACEIDPDSIDNVRQRMPIQQHRDAATDATK